MSTFIVASHEFKQIVSKSINIDKIKLILLVFWSFTPQIIRPSHHILNFESSHGDNSEQHHSFRYHIYPKYLVTLSTYHTCPTVFTLSIGTPYLLTIHDLPYLP